MATEADTGVPICETIKVEVAKTEDQATSILLKEATTDYIQDDAFRVKTQDKFEEETILLKEKIGKPVEYVKASALGETKETVDSLKDGSDTNDLQIQSGKTEERTAEALVSKEATATLAVQNVATTISDEGSVENLKSEPDELHMKYEECFEKESTESLASKAPVKDDITHELKVENEENTLPEVEAQSHISSSKCASEEISAAVSSRDIETAILFEQNIKEDFHQHMDDLNEDKTMDIEKEKNVEIKEEITKLEDQATDVSTNECPEEEKIQASQTYVLSETAEGKFDLDHEMEGAHSSKQTFADEQILGSSNVSGEVNEGSNAETATERQVEVPNKLEPSEEIVLSYSNPTDPERTGECSSIQVEDSEMKHDECLGKKNEDLSLAETTVSDEKTPEVQNILLIVPKEESENNLTPESQVKHEEYSDKETIESKAPEKNEHVHELKVDNEEDTLVEAQNQKHVESLQDASEESCTADSSQEGETKVSLDQIRTADFQQCLGDQIEGKTTDVKEKALEENEQSTEIEDQATNISASNNPEEDKIQVPHTIESNFSSEAVKEEGITSSEGKFDGEHMLGSYEAPCKANEVSPNSCKIAKEPGETAIDDREISVLSKDESDDKPEKVTSTEANCMKGSSGNAETTAEGQVGIENKSEPSGESVGSCSIQTATETARENSSIHVEDSETKHDEFLKNENDNLSLTEAARDDIGGDESEVKPKVKVEEEVTLLKENIERPVEFLHTAIEDIKESALGQNKETTDPLNDASHTSDSQETQTDKIDERTAVAAASEVETHEVQDVSTAPKDDNKDNIEPKVDLSQLKHEEFEKKSTESRALVKDEEHASLEVEEALTPKHEESLQDASGEMSTADSNQDRETPMPLEQSKETMNSLNEEIHTSDPRDIHSIIANERTVDAAVLEEEIHEDENVSPVSLEENKDNAKPKVDESKLKHEECFEKESKESKPAVKDEESAVPEIEEAQPGMHESLQDASGESSMAVSSQDRATTMSGKQNFIADTMDVEKEKALEEKQENTEIESQATNLSPSELPKEEIIQADQLCDTEENNVDLEHVKEGIASSEQTFEGEKILGTHEFSCEANEVSPNYSKVAEEPKETAINDTEILFPNKDKVDDLPQENIVLEENCVKGGQENAETSTDKHVEVEKEFEPSGVSVGSCSVQIATEKIGGNSSIQVEDSETKDDECLETENDSLSLTKAARDHIGDDESEVKLKVKIEGEVTLLKEKIERPEEFLHTDTEDIKASALDQNKGTTNPRNDASHTSDPQETQTDRISERTAVAAASEVETHEVQDVSTAPKDDSKDNIIKSKVDESHLKHEEFEKENTETKASIKDEEHASLEVEEAQPPKHEESLQDASGEISMAASNQDRETTIPPEQTLTSDCQQHLDDQTDDMAMDVVKEKALEEKEETIEIQDQASNVSPIEIPREEKIQASQLCEVSDTTESNSNSEHVKEGNESREQTFEHVNIMGTSKVSCGAKEVLPSSYIIAEEPGETAINDTDISFQSKIEDPPQENIASEEKGHQETAETTTERQVEPAGENVESCSNPTAMEETGKKSSAQIENSETQDDECLEKENNLSMTDATEDDASKVQPKVAFEEKFEKQVELMHTVVNDVKASALGQNENVSTTVPEEESEDILKHDVDESQMKYEECSGKQSTDTPVSEAPVKDESIHELKVEDEVDLSPKADSQTQTDVDFQQHMDSQIEDKAKDIMKKKALEAKEECTEKEDQAQNILANEHSKEETIQTDQLHKLSESTESNSDLEHVEKVIKTSEEAIEGEKFLEPPLGQTVKHDPKISLEHDGHLGKEATVPETTVDDFKEDDSTVTFDSKFEEEIISLKEQTVKPEEVLHAAIEDIKESALDQEKDITSSKEQTEKPEETLHASIEDIRESAPDQDKETSSFNHANLTAVPREILSDRCEERTADIAALKEETPEVQNISAVVSNEANEDYSTSKVDDSQQKHEECFEKESKESSDNKTLIKDENDDETVIHETKIEEEFLSETNKSIEISPIQKLTVDNQEILDGQTEDDTTDLEKKETLEVQDKVKDVSNEETGSCEGTFKREALVGTLNSDAIEGKEAEQERPVESQAAPQDIKETAMSPSPTDSFEDQKLDVNQHGILDEKAAESLQAQISTETEPSDSNQDIDSTCSLGEKTAHAVDGKEEFVEDVTASISNEKTGEKSELLYTTVLGVDGEKSMQIDHEDVTSSISRPDTDTICRAEDQNLTADPEGTLVHKVEDITVEEKHIENVPAIVLHEESKENVLNLVDGSQTKQEEQFNHESEQQTAIGTFKKDVDGNSMESLNVACKGDDSLNQETEKVHEIFEEETSTKSLDKYSDKEIGGTKEDHSLIQHKEIASVVPEEEVSAKLLDRALVEETAETRDEKHVESLHSACKDEKSLDQEKELDEEVTEEKPVESLHVVFQGDNSLIHDKEIGKAELNEELSTTLNITHEEDKALSQKTEVTSEETREEKHVESLLGTHMDKAVSPDIEIDEGKLLSTLHVAPQEEVALCKDTEVKETIDREESRQSLNLISEDDEASSKDKEVVKQMVEEEHLEPAYVAHQDMEAVDEKDIESSHVEKDKISCQDTIVANKEEQQEKSLSVAPKIDNEDISTKGDEANIVASQPDHQSREINDVSQTKALEDPETIEDRDTDLHMPYKEDQTEPRSVDTEVTAHRSIENFYETTEIQRENITDNSEGVHGGAKIEDTDGQEMAISECPIQEVEEIRQKTEKHDYKSTQTTQEGSEQIQSFADYPAEKVKEVVSCEEENKTMEPDTEAAGNTENGQCYVEAKEMVKEEGDHKDHQTITAVNILEQEEKGTDTQNINPETEGSNATEVVNTAEDSDCDKKQLSTEVSDVAEIRHEFQDATGRIYEAEENNDHRSVEEVSSKQSRECETVEGLDDDSTKSPTEECQVNADPKDGAEETVPCMKKELEMQENLVGGATKKDIEDDQPISASQNVARDSDFTDEMPKLEGVSLASVNEITIESKELTSTETTDDFLPGSINKYALDKEGLTVEELEACKNEESKNDKEEEAVEQKVSEAGGIAESKEIPVPDSLDEDHESTTQDQICNVTSEAKEGEIKEVNSKTEPAEIGSEEIDKLTQTTHEPTETTQANVPSNKVHKEDQDAKNASTEEEIIQASCQKDEVNQIEDPKIKEEKMFEVINDPSEKTEFKGSDSEIVLLDSKENREGADYVDTGMIKDAVLLTKDVKCSSVVEKTNEDILLEATPSKLTQNTIEEFEGNEGPNSTITPQKDDNEIEHKSLLLSEPLVASNKTCTLDKVELKDENLVMPSVENHEEKAGEADSHDRLTEDDIAKACIEAEKLDFPADKQVDLPVDLAENTSPSSSICDKNTPELQSKVFKECSSQAEAEKLKSSQQEQEEENCINEARTSEETTEASEKTESTDVHHSSLTDLLHKVSAEEIIPTADKCTTEKDPAIHKENLQAEKAHAVGHEDVKTDEEKDSGEESGEHQASDCGSEAPVMVEAGDADVKVVHKKSHNLLSGVGSKMKHSIAKVKKAITGKSPHPKPPSPK